MWRKLKVWIPREEKTKNTGKYHISHTGGEDIERGEEIYVYLKVIGMKNKQLKLSKSL